MNVTDEVRTIKRELSLINGRLMSARRAVSGGGTPHALLSVTHTDTTAAGPVVGDLIYANATPKWTRLPAGGAAQVLTIVGGVPAWAAAAGAAHNLLSATHTDTTAAAAVAGDIIYADATPKWIRLAVGGAAQVLTVVGGVPAWAAAGGGAHNVLSATHTDSTAAAAVAGDIIYADATPKWTRLAAGGAAQVLTIVAGFPAWAAAGGGGAHDILSATHSDTTAAAVTRGDIITGQAAAPNTKWKRLAIGASTTYLKGGTEPTWATLNQAAVAGLTTASTPSFVGVTATAGSFKLPATQIEGQTYGVYETTDTLIRTFRPTGSDGYNLFICIGAGNNTMSPGGGSTAYSSRNICIGAYSGNSITTGYHLVGVGYFTNYMAQNAYFSTAIGGLALYQDVSGYENLAAGYYTLFQSQGYQCSAGGAYSSASNMTGNQITAYGAYSFYTQTAASGGVALGFEAGYYETAANKLFIDNQKRTNEADARVKALIYGVFNAATASQSLMFNCAVSIRHNLTMIGNIVIPNGGTVGQAAGPLLNFDDTNNYLEITGCNVGIATTTPGTVLEMVHNVNYGAANDMLTIRSAQSGGVNSNPYDYGTIVWQTTGVTFGRITLVQDNPGSAWLNRFDFLLTASGGAPARVMTVTSGGDFWVAADCSALTFTDRTPLARSLAEAYAAVRSVQGEGGRLDHSKLHPFLISPNGGRNLSALASAQAQVIQDLEARIKTLENGG